MSSVAAWPVSANYTLAWTYFDYNHVAFTFIFFFKLDKLPDRQFGESVGLDFKVDEKALTEAKRKEAIRPDDELIREGTFKPKFLEIRWTDRKCVGP